MLGIPSDEGVNELLELVGLHGTGNKKARNFSLGMRQRLVRIFNYLEQPAKE